MNADDASGASSGAGERFIIEKLHPTNSVRTGWDPLEVRPAVGEF